jgi:hypothetical protein
MVWLSKLCYLCFEKPFLTSAPPVSQVTAPEQATRIPPEAVQEHAAP